jgi:Oligosaccharyltransferase 48 kDa subunit beta
LKDYSQESTSDVLYSSNFFEPFKTTSKGIFTTSGKIAFGSGVGQTIDSSNQYAFPILRAEQSTVSVKEDGSVAKVSGEAITLVSGYQTRGNQRVSVVGSLSMCSNDNIQLT